MTSATTFTIAAVEAFHVVARDRSYWNEFKQENRATSERHVLKPGWRAAYTRNFETAIVKVTLADGTVGWGEATEPICPEVIGRLAVHLIAPFIGGRAYEHPAAAWTTPTSCSACAAYRRLPAHAMAAIDIALWDGRPAQRPAVSAMLAENPARRVPCLSLRHPPRDDCGAHRNAG